MLDPLSKAIERAALEREPLTIKSQQRAEPDVREYSRQAANALDALRYSETPVRPIPGGGLRPHDAPDSPAGAAARGYDILKTKILQKLNQDDSNLLVITSPTEGNGKTTTAAHLATSIARSVDQTVLLVDLNLRNPEVHKYFGVTPEKGITDLIEGHSNFSDVAFNPGVPRLVVLPGRESITHSPEFLSTPAIKHFIDEVRDRYPQRIIIFDMPPVLGNADVISFMPYVDNYLLVIEAGKTTTRELKDAQRALQGSTIIGTVLNRSQDIKKGY